MAVVTTTFSNTANQNWITSTGWVATDPAFKVNTQLTNWVNAIGNSSIIEIVKTPNDATSKSSFSLVQWMLRCRDGDTANGDYGFIYNWRYAGPGNAASTYAVSYFNRLDTTANNGYGDYSTFSNTYYMEDFSNAGNFFIAYEAVGTTPWFVYSYENALKTVRYYKFLLRLDTSSAIAGSYYPSAGLGKWIYVFGYGSGSGSPSMLISTPSSNLSAPYKGVVTSGWGLQYPAPTTTNNYGDNYFFRLLSQYGAAHYLGQPTNDILISNTNTGVWGDTAVVDGVTYTCLRAFWVKTS